MRSRSAKTKKSAVEEFLAQKTLAVVGVSRSPRKFGHMAYCQLRGKGYKVLAVNPQAASVAGDPCYRDLQSLPEPAGGVLVVVKRSLAEQVVKDAGAAGIRRVWLQQGSASAAAIRLAEEQGMQVVHGHCILMFAEPVASFHKFHRALWGLLGKLPR
jgi:hypothetical protein